MRYIIAVRREARDKCPELGEFLRGIPGLLIRGRLNRQRVEVEASPEVIEDIRGRIGALCRIEPVIIHHVSNVRVRGLG